MLADALERLVRRIVDRPEDVKVACAPSVTVKRQVRVHPDDLGRLSAGRTAKSIRLVMDGISDGEPMRIVSTRQKATLS